MCSVGCWAARRSQSAARRAAADGELVLEAEDIMCSLMDAETLQDRETSRRLYETLVRA